MSTTHMILVTKSWLDYRSTIELAQKLVEISKEGTRTAVRNHGVGV